MWAGISDGRRVVSRALRQEANRLILERLAAEIEAHPDLRFGQILVNLGVLQVNRQHLSPTDWVTSVADPFYEESTATLARMEQRAGE